jgi:hypothetical protein
MLRHPPKLGHDPSDIEDCPSGRFNKLAASKRKSASMKQKKKTAQPYSTASSAITTTEPADNMLATSTSSSTSDDGTAAFHPDKRQCVKDSAAFLLGASDQAPASADIMRAENESLKTQLANAKAQLVAAGAAHQQQISELIRQLTSIMAMSNQRITALEAATSRPSAPSPEVTQLASLLAETNQRFAALEAAMLQPPAVSSPPPAAPGAASSQPPPATWASTVRGTGPQQQQPQQRPRARQPSGSPTSGLAAATSQQCCFVISGSQAETSALAGRRGDALVAAASALLSERLSLPAGEVRILDAIPLGKVLPTDPPTRRLRFFIRVERLAQADAIVANRHKLKGSQLAVFDDLSPEERAAHWLLWPTFVAARRLGFTAQYCRSKLVVTKRTADGAIAQRYTIWP